MKALPLKTFLDTLFIPPKGKLCPFFPLKFNLGGPHSAIQSSECS